MLLNKLSLLKKLVVMALILPQLAVFASANEDLYQKRLQRARANNAIRAWLIVGPKGAWSDKYGNHWPAAMIMRDLHEMGVNETLYEDKMLGVSFHQSSVKYVTQAKFMGKRDFLEETLKEADKYNIDVYVTWTPDDRGASAQVKKAHMPLYYKCENGKVKVGYYDLGSPIVRQMYLDKIDELYKKYGHHKSLVGIDWHELDVTEAVNSHHGDINKFKKFCTDKFKETYSANSFPKFDVNNKWWRRYAIFRQECVNDFLRVMKERSRKYGLLTSFQLYSTADRAAGSWSWGYNPVEIEKLCDSINVSTSNIGSSRKTYMSYRGGRWNLGLSYKGANLAEKYAFSVCPGGLFYWESRISTYPEATRVFYAKHGLKNFYTTYNLQSPKSVSLFAGKNNLQKWFNIFNSYGQGKDCGQTALLVNLNSFCLKYPRSPGRFYNRYIKELDASLSKRMDIDALSAGGVNWQKASDLKRYKLLIIPQGMGTFIRSEFNTDELYKYISTGGKILVINTKLETTQQDLTQCKSLMKKILGLDITPQNGDLKAQVNGKFISIARRNIKIGDAKIIVQCSKSGLPVLTEKSIDQGKAYYLNAPFLPENANYFDELITRLAVPAVSKDGNGTILEVTAQKDIVAISLRGKSKNQVRVNLNKLGNSIKDNILVKNIVSNKTFGPLTSQSLETKGFTANITHTNEPAIFVIGRAEQIEAIKPLYKDCSVFNNIEYQMAPENPEVVLKVPSRAGVKVGVYTNAYGANSLIKSIESIKGYNPFLLPRISKDCIEQCDIVIIPQTLQPARFNNSLKYLRQWVAQGGRLLLTHDAVGFRNHKVLFPKIAEGMGCDTTYVFRMALNVPKMNKGIDRIHAYSDHVLLEKKNPDAITWCVNRQGASIVIADTHQKGKVVFCGIILGIGSTFPGSTDTKEVSLKPGEQHLLEFMLQWLCKAPKTIENGDFSQTKAQL